MIFDGIRFRLQPSLKFRVGDDGYVQFARPTNPGHGATHWPVHGWVTLIPVTYSLTNMGSDSEGRMYLAYDGQVYASAKPTKADAQKAKRDADIREAVRKFQAELDATAPAIAKVLEDFREEQS